MENIILYKKNLTIEENIFDWLNKLYNRANFDCVVERQVTVPDELTKYVGSLDEVFYGDRDLLFKFSAKSWNNLWCEEFGSTRNIEISGFMPIHISKNGRPMFGWCKGGATTPDSLKFIFTICEKSETYSLFELGEIIKESFVCYSKENHKLSDFLFDLFLLANFRVSEDIKAIDNR